MSIRESDWKTLRQLHPIALERFCERVLVDVNRIITADGGKSPRQRYLHVYELLQERDRRLAKIFNDSRRSTALIQLASMSTHDLLTDEEFGRFSKEIQNLIGIMKGNPRD